MNIFTERFEQLKNQHVKAPTYHWQEQALEAMKSLGIEKRYTGSIMRAYRNKPDKAEAVKRNMEGKKFKNPALYFLKLMSL